VNLTSINSKLTSDGQIRLSSLEFSYLDDLVKAGDRGGFHYLYGELANNQDSLLTAKIATFSDNVGGKARDFAFSRRLLISVGSGNLVEQRGIEPLTSSLRTTRSPN
jgi:hypothetical protein